MLLIYPPLHILLVSCIGMSCSTLVYEFLNPPPPPSLPPSQAEQVLLAAVESPSISEQWASLQCLGGAGVGPAPVVSGLLLQLLAGREPRRKERAAELLARLSAKTVSCSRVYQLLPVAMAYLSACDKYGCTGKQANRHGKT